MVLTRLHRISMHPVDRLTFMVVEISMGISLKMHIQLQAVMNNLISKTSLNLKKNNSIIDELLSEIRLKVRLNHL